jgi:hypothetical protein
MQGNACVGVINQMLSALSTLFTVSNVNAVDIFRLGWVLDGSGAGIYTHYEVLCKKTTFHSLS